MTDTRITQLRDIEIQMLDMKKKMEELEKQKLHILELDRGTRKTQREMLSRQDRKALFAELKRDAHERSEEKRR